MADRHPILDAIEVAAGERWMGVIEVRDAGCANVEVVRWQGGVAVGDLERGEGSGAKRCEFGVPGNYQCVH